MTTVVAFKTDRVVHLARARSALEAAKSEADLIALQLGNVQRKHRRALGVLAGAEALVRFLEGRRETPKDGDFEHIARLFEGRAPCDTEDRA